MAWSTPSARTTGDLITAAIWNQDVVDNSQFLHDRVRELWIPWVAYYGSGLSEGNVGDWRSVAVVNNSINHIVWFSFCVPSDFASLAGLHLLVAASTSTTYEYDVNTDYGASGETYNVHSGQAVNQTVALTANQYALLDLSGLVGSLSAGDFVGLNLSNSNGANAGTLHVLGLRLRYNRT